MTEPAPRRGRLPDRRPNLTIDLEFEGRRYHVTIGYALDGTPREIFAHGAKVGSTMDRLLDDACVNLSLMLQLDVAPRDLAHSMGRFEDGSASSIIGALIDLLAEEAGFDAGLAK